MDSHNIEDTVENDDGFKGFTTSEVTGESSEVTKSDIVQNVTRDETKKDGNVTTAEAPSNSSCDNNSSNVSLINNSNECKGCVKEVNIEMKEENILIDSKDISESKTTAAENRDVASTASETSAIKSSICPDDENLQNIPIQEVLNKVDKMTIVEKPNNKQVSSVIIKNDSSSLRNLLMYHTDSSDNEEENEDFEACWRHSIFPSSSSSSESESESQECVEISDDEDENNVEFVLPNNKNHHKKDSKHEDDLDVSPPLDISNLHIDYEKEQFTHIGEISNFINATVTVDTLDNVASYNIETVLFVDDKTSKKPLGGITDVIGPVSRPVYCIQLGDAKEIERLGLKEGMKVYSAPKSSCTKYVFLKDLLKMKGTDASWIGDEEPPSDGADTSDEEYELKDSKSRKRGHNSSLERHKQFEKDRNRSNIMKTRVADLMDRYRKVTRGENIHMFPHGFDPKVPPPAVQQNMSSPGFFDTPPNLNRQPPYHWFTLPNVQHRFPNQRNRQTRPRHNHTNLLANNVGYHHNSPGPSNQNYF